MKTKTVLCMAVALFFLMGEAGCKKNEIDEGIYINRNSVCFNKENNTFIDSVATITAVVFRDILYNDVPYYGLTVSNSFLSTIENTELATFLKIFNNTLIPCPNLPEAYQINGLKVQVSGNVFECKIDDTPESILLCNGLKFDLTFIRKH